MHYAAIREKRKSLDTTKKSALWNILLSGEKKDTAEKYAILCKKGKKEPHR